jgi:hypothetical protein
MTQAPALERISIEVTNQCGKACWFCYNGSQPGGATRWTPDELVAFVTDCAAHGVKAVSFGGGEPLQYDGLCDVLTRLRGVLFRSLTSNGLAISSPPAVRTATSPCTMPLATPWNLPCTATPARYSDWASRRTAARSSLVVPTARCGSGMSRVAANGGRSAGTAAG